MKKSLREINEIIGVWGSLVCGNQGEIIEAVTPPGLTKLALENTIRQVISTFSKANQAVPDVSEVIHHFNDKKLFVMDLGKGFLVVICTPSVDISLLRMTANVILTAWKGDPKFQKIFDEHLVERI
jgi:predicted regulator of Ras-like GTPase activity (Roadblock/LC7/MglB family)